MNSKERLFYFAISFLNLLAGQLHLDWLNFTTKPLLMISLGLIYYRHIQSKISFADKLILIALFFSCVGDVLLMLQRYNSQLFLFGLLGFLVTQIAYSWVFSLEYKRNFYYRIPFIVYSYGIFLLIKSDISDTLIVPIFIYMIAITTMGIRAAERIANPSSYKIVLFGAIFFILSDSIIAINKFSYTIPMADFLIMSTYIIGQYLIIDGLIKKKASA